MFKDPIVIIGQNKKRKRGDILGTTEAAEHIVQ